MKLPSVNGGASIPQLIIRSGGIRTQASSHPPGPNFSTPPESCTSAVVDVYVGS